ncbi:MAG: sigma-70 family RNA polymerase sigma factor [Phycisphaerae bacterium]|nr:sigma-70 family RNA polymerase sigma factor [Phycisphaerae bacterium]
MVNRAGKTTPTAPPVRAQHEDRPAAQDVARWRVRLVRLAYRFLWNWHDAEDAVQDALAVAEGKREQIRSLEKWWPWVTRILVNRCHELRRRPRIDPDRLASSAQPADRTAGEISRRELAELLKDLIAELPEQQRTALVLRHLQAMPYRDIAGIMGVSESTARVHASLAREALREMIVTRHPEWERTD